VKTLHRFKVLDKEKYRCPSVSGGLIPGHPGIPTSNQECSCTFYKVAWCLPATYTHARMYSKSFLDHLQYLIRWSAIWTVILYYLGNNGQKIELCTCSVQTRFFPNISDARFGQPAVSTLWVSTLVLRSSTSSCLCTYEFWKLLFSLYQEISQIS
jgi:hypothetical protein